MSNVFFAGYAGWPAYDTFLIMSLSSWPVYDPNSLRSNPNSKKPVSCSQVGSNINTPTSEYPIGYREEKKWWRILTPGLDDFWPSIWPARLRSLILLFLSTLSVAHSWTVAAPRSEKKKLYIIIYIYFICLPFKKN